MLQLRTARFAALANVCSGGFGAARVRRFERLLTETLGSQCGPVTAVEPGALDAALDRIAVQRPEAVIVLGGDGTARAALRRLSSEGVAVAPLPGGALSRISKSVYGDAATIETLRGLARGAPAALPAGTINGEAFYCAAGYGAPMALASVREHLRARRPVRAAMAAAGLVGRAFAPAFTCEGAEARVAVTAPGPVDAAFGFAAPGAGSAPELALADWRGAAEAVLVWPSVLSGDWRAADGVTARPVRRTTLASLEGPLPLLVDGEALAPAETARIAYGGATGLVWRPCPDRGERTREGRA